VAGQRPEVGSGSAAARCWYVDAFAGTGERLDRRGHVESTSGSLFGEEADAVISAKEGSVQIALKIDPPFKRYVFIDRSKNHIDRLNKLRSEHPDRSIDVRPDDANEELAKLCSGTDWTSTRAAVFVDPYGMQVSWSTLEHLARTEAVDVALLFPTGPLNRLLKRDGAIPPEWEHRIDDHLGPCDWRAAFYRERIEKDLFETLAATEKNVDLAGLQAFVAARLQEIFPYVHETVVPLKNSKGSVLYDLFIICANPSPKAIALVKKLAKGAIGATTKARS
jgi:three-Cys-motif partner protein